MTDAMIVSPPAPPPPTVSTPDFSQVARSYLAQSNPIVLQQARKSVLAELFEMGGGRAACFALSYLNARSPAPGSDHHKTTLPMLGTFPTDAGVAVAALGMGFLGLSGGYNDMAIAVSGAAFDVVIGRWARKLAEGSRQQQAVRGELAAGPAATRSLPAPRYSPAAGQPDGFRAIG